MPPPMEISPWLFFDWPLRQLFYCIDQCNHVFDRCFLKNTVPKIENMTGPTRNGTKQFIHSGVNDIWISKQHRGIKVSLH